MQQYQGGGGFLGAAGAAAVNAYSSLMQNQASLPSYQPTPLSQMNTIPASNVTADDYSQYPSTYSSYNTYDRGQMQSYDSYDYKEYNYKPKSEVSSVYQSSSTYDGYSKKDSYSSKDYTTYYGSSANSRYREREPAVLNSASRNVIPSEKVLDLTALAMTSSWQYCDICNEQFQQEKDYVQHILGLPHMRNRIALEDSKNSEPSGQAYNDEYERQDYPRDQGERNSYEENLYAPYSHRERHDTSRDRSLEQRNDSYLTSPQSSRYNDGAQKYDEYRSSDVRREEAYGSGSYATRADGSGSYTTRADGSGSYATRADGSGSYATRADGSGSYATRADGSGSYATLAAGGGSYAARADGSGSYTARADDKNDYFTKQSSTDMYFDTSGDHKDYSGGRQSENNYKYDRKAVFGERSPMGASRDPQPYKDGFSYDSSREPLYQDKDRIPGLDLAVSSRKRTWNDEYGEQERRGTGDMPFYGKSSRQSFIQPVDRYLQEDRSQYGAQRVEPLLPTSAPWHNEKSQNTSQVIQPLMPPSMLRRDEKPQKKVEPLYSASMMGRDDKSQNRLTKVEPLVSTNMSRRGEHTQNRQPKVEPLLPTNMPWKKEKPQEQKKTSMQCMTCNLHFNHEYTTKQHMQGKKHLRQLIVLQEDHGPKEFYRLYGDKHTPIPAPGKFANRFVEDMVKRVFYEHDWTGQPNPEKEAYKTFVKKSGELAKFYCSVCDQSLGCMELWIAHVMRKYHDKMCTQREKELGGSLFKARYGHLPGRNPLIKKPEDWEFGPQHARTKGEKTSTVSKAADVSGGTVRPAASARPAGGTGRGKDAKPANDAGTGKNVRPAEGSSKGKDVQPAEGAGRGKDVRPADGAGKGSDARPAEGTGRGKDVRPADGAGKGRDARSADGAGRGRDANPASSASRGRDVRPSAGRGMNTGTERARNDGRRDASSQPQRGPSDVSSAMLAKSRSPVKIDKSHGIKPLVGPTASLARPAMEEWQRVRLVQNLPSNYNPNQVAEFYEVLVTSIETAVNKFQEVQMYDLRQMMQMLNQESLQLMNSIQQMTDVDDETAARVTLVLNTIDPDVIQVLGNLDPELIQSLSSSGDLAGGNFTNMLVALRPNGNQQQSGNLPQGGVMQLDGNMRPHSDNRQPGGNMQQLGGNRPQPGGNIQLIGGNKQPARIMPLFGRMRYSYRQRSGFRPQTGIKPQPGGKNKQVLATKKWQQGKTPQPVGIKKPGGNQPLQNKTEPSGKVQQPGGNKPQSGGNIQQPKSNSQQPVGNKPQPANKMQQPGNQLSQPDNEKSQPGGKIQQPGSNPSTPGGKAQTNGGSGLDSRIAKLREKRRRQRQRKKLTQTKPN